MRLGPGVPGANGRRMGVVSAPGREAGEVVDDMARVDARLKTKGRFRTGEGGRSA
ncbi:MAG: hypothetical protein AMXMBFR80_28940 [Dehalococcoidia bacterium]